MARIPAAALPAGALRSGCRGPATAQQAVPHREHPSAHLGRLAARHHRPRAASERHPAERSAPVAAGWAWRAALEAEYPSGCHQQTADERHRRREAASEHRPGGRSEPVATGWARQAASQKAQKAEPPSGCHWRADERGCPRPAAEVPAVREAGRPEPSVRLPQAEAGLVAAAEQWGVRAAPDVQRPGAHAAGPPRAVREAPDARGEPHAAQARLAASGALAERRDPLRGAVHRQARHGVPRDQVRAGRGARGPSLYLPVWPLLSRPAPSGWWPSRRGHRRRGPDTRPTVRGSTRWSSA